MKLSVRLYLIKLLSHNNLTGSYAHVHIQFTYFNLRMTELDKDQTSTRNFLFMYNMSESVLKMKYHVATLDVKENISVHKSY